MSNNLMSMNPMLREIFRLAYNYRQKYQNPSGTEDFWRCAAAEMSKLVEHFGHHSFAEAMLLSCYTDIEREYKENLPPEQIRLTEILS